MNDEQQFQLAQQNAVAIARMEATLEAVKNMAGHSERNAQQMVRLMEERLLTQYAEVTRRLDTVDKRLDDMDRKRDLARLEDEAHRRELAELVEDRSKALGDRVSGLENWKAKVAGIAVGVGSVAGAASAGIVNALGG